MSFSPEVMGVLEGSQLWERFLSTRAELYRCLKGPISDHEDTSRPDAPGERKCQCPCGEARMLLGRRCL